VGVKIATSFVNLAFGPFGKIEEEYKHKLEAAEFQEIRKFLQCLLLLEELVTHVDTGNLRIFLLDH
jgi:hypothetical protein